MVLLNENVFLKHPQLDQIYQNKSPRIFHKYKLDVFGQKMYFNLQNFEDVGQVQSVWPTVVQTQKEKPIVQ